MLSGEGNVGRNKGKERRRINDHLGEGGIEELGRV
jgi:hypothetical protein